jgi:poly-gamma-glutamate synthesis protein (capsule biosynthesis protein)
MNILCAHNAQPAPGLRFRLAAVGDLLFVTKPWDRHAGRGLESLSQEVRDLFASCDMVFANLECTLPGRETVSTEPRVIASPGQIQSLRDAGIHVVTLGNNHAFDCMDEGFHRLRDMLGDLGITSFGAGDTFAEAARPAVVELGGGSVAFIAAVDPSTGPCRYATETSSGVVHLDTGKMCATIKSLRKTVDHVIVSPHWGKERFRIPSPGQIEQARAFVDAGATMVLGHHPHVLQGLERYREAAVAYSLGNFVTNHVYWDSGDYLTWGRFERTGSILVAELGSNGIHAVQQIPTYDDGKTIRLEVSRWGNRCITKVNHLLARGVTPKRYHKEAFRVSWIHPFLSHLRWAKLRQLRTRLFGKALRRRIR